MEIVENDLAAVEKASAFGVGDLLLVRLAGSKPTACHLVSIERALTDAEPPAFVARLAMDPRARCMDVVAQYEEVRAFRIGTPREEVLVHHAGGVLTVEVEQLAVDGDTEGRGALAGPGGSARAATGGLLDLPFGEPAEEYGYSRSFDLGEAVKDAIGKLPPRGAGIPDWLSSYSVVSLDVEIGGIAGFSHLRVTVRG